MKSVARIKRPYIYVIVILIVSSLIVGYGDFEIAIDGLRWIAITLSTIVGILIGLVSAIVATVVRISMSQKQFYQGILANESQWLERWFATHPGILSQLEDEVKEVMYGIYRHSTIAEFSDEELMNKIGRTMPLLTGEWRKRVIEAPEDCLIKQSEIEEFEKHLRGTGATLCQIKASKDRMELGKYLSDILWPLGFVLLLALTVILCCSTPNIAMFINDYASRFALALIVIACISVFSLIFVVTLYIRTEVREIKNVVKTR